MGLLVLVLAVAPRDRNSLERGAADGLLLGGALAFSSFNGGLLVLLYAVLRARPRSPSIAVATSGAGWPPVRWRPRSYSAVLGLTLAVGMVQRTPNAFVFGWNRHFLRGPWRFVLYNFGPALFLAPLAIGLSALRGRLGVVLASPVLVAAAVFLGFDVRGHENTYVVFRAAQLVFLVLAVLLALAIDRWRVLAATGRVGAGRRAGRRQPGGVPDRRARLVQRARHVQRGHEPGPLPLDDPPDAPRAGGRRLDPAGPAGGRNRPDRRPRARPRHLGAGPGVLPPANGDGARTVRVGAPPVRSQHERHPRHVLEHRGRAGAADVPPAGHRVRCTWGRSSGRRTRRGSRNSAIAPSCSAPCSAWGRRRSSRSFGERPERRGRLSSFLRVGAGWEYLAGRQP